MTDLLSAVSGAGGSGPSSGVGLALEIDVNDTPLPDNVMAKVVRVDVESHLTLPDSIAVTFSDFDRTVITDAGFELGSPIKVKADLTSDPSGDLTELAEGEITALEVESGHGGTMTVVRGLDKSHRLFKGTAVKAYQEMTASDVVEEIAGDSDLEPMSDPTDTTYTVLTRGNQTDWDFIQQLARESNRMAFASQGTLYFIKPITTDMAPDVPDGTSPLLPGQLLLGENLQRINTTITAAEQVSSVEVLGWDPSQKAAIVGEGDAGTVSASNDDDPSTIAGMFGGKTYVYTDIPYSDQGQADTTAAAIAERFGSAFVEVDGECMGTSWLMAGIPVAIGGTGDPFDGKYLVTSARHLIDEGYRTEFTVSGIRDTTFAGLANSEWQKQRRHIVHGVAIGTVSSVKDPTNSGLVQLSFPWLDPDYVSDWCRVLQPGAGSAWGNIFLPEVNSEVLVAFDQGDIRLPYVIGGLYNGQDTINPQSDVPLIDDGTGAVNQRLYQSRTMHFLYFNDSQTAPCVVLQSAAGTMLKIDDTSSSPSAVLQDKQGQVMLKFDLQSGDITLTTNNGKVTIESQSGDIDLNGMNINLNAQQGLSMQANSQAQLQCSGTVSISGSMTSINS